MGFKEMFLAASLAATPSCLITEKTLERWEEEAECIDIADKTLQKDQKACEGTADEQDCRDIAYDMHDRAMEACANVD